MIQKLLDQILALLRTGLVGTVPNPPAHILLGQPVANPRPLLVICGGDLRMGAPAADFSTSKPRPMELQEEFTVPASLPQAPYTLAKTPLAGSAMAKLVSDKGGPQERRRLIVENKDFSIDYANARLTLHTELTGVSHLQLGYSFAGIFFLQEFHQDFYIEVLDQENTVLEKLTSLAATIIFTHHDELIEAYNQTDRTLYTATRYLSEHLIGRLAWSESQIRPAGRNTSLKLRFTVNGQIKHVRQDVSGFGIIEKIHSPDKPATAGVHIAPQLG